MSQNSNRNKLVVPGAKNAIDQMKYEIANELGVNLGPDASARSNGSVGGEITKRLVEMGQKQMSASSNYNQSKQYFESAWDFGNRNPMARPDEHGAAVRDHRAHVADAAVVHGVPARRFAERVP